MIGLAQVWPIKFFFTHSSCTNFCKWIKRNSFIITIRNINFEKLLNLMNRIIMIDKRNLFKTSLCCFAVQIGFRSCSLKLERKKMCKIAIFNGISQSPYILVANVYIIMKERSVKVGLRLAKLPRGSLAEKAHCICIYVH